MSMKRSRSVPLAGPDALLMRIATRTRDRAPRDGSQRTFRRMACPSAASMSLRATHPFWKSRHSVGASASRSVSVSLVLSGVLLANATPVAGPDPQRSRTV